MSQPGYDNNQPSQPYTAPPTYQGVGAVGCSPEYAEGKKAQQNSLLFGILGLFFFGFIFGPLAIITAKKAERMGCPSNAGKVLGWIACAICALGVLLSLIMVIGLVASSIQ
ncbi:hypothetical protein IV500_04700 [Paeniglutamicibacter antarcticus]|uniref:DUF4190 domain-containing protein n=1 Tax=Arthrobacter terrae TaxID=2935737 RepID=A0A931G9I1_9MICC|nr:hypothetical protein [Arthrobacter terrae]MBG0738717.1 hypothetical protein [Arthrobacter terrae]